MNYWMEEFIRENEREMQREFKNLNIPVVMWRFCAYRTEKDYESGEHYFIKDFLDHTEMKVFSGEHSTKEKPLYPDYCSMYWKIETNAT